MCPQWCRLGWKGCRSLTLHPLPLSLVVTEREEEISVPFSHKWRLTWSSLTVDAGMGSDVRLGTT